MTFSPAVLNDVDVRNGVRIVTATVDGVRYEIPEVWLAGACRTRTLPEAVRHWHEQATMRKVERGVGVKVMCNGYPGTITRVCEWDDVLVEVRLASGTVCLGVDCLKPRGEG